MLSRRGRQGEHQEDGHHGESVMIPRDAALTVTSSGRVLV